jgi:SAM-dependent methyltransferase
LNEPFVEAFSKIKKLDGNETVVELGFGAGAISQWIALNLTRGGKLVAFDIDAAAVKKASYDAENSGLSNVLFEVGSVYEIPLPDNYADLVVCKNLLCTLTNVQGAIIEMKRVAKPGGSILVIEPCSSQIIIDPSDQKFTLLSQRLNAAFHDGWQSLGVDQYVGFKIPQLLVSAGLVDVTVEAYVKPNLMCDSSRSFEDVVEQLLAENTLLDQETIRLLANAGFSQMDFDEFHELSNKRLSYYSTNRQATRSNAYLRITPIQLLSLAHKPGPSS